MTGLYVEIVAYLFGFALIIAYYAFIRARLNKDRSYTIQSVNSDARAAWVDNIMSDPSKAILAVQTLRNSTMAATFLASTAILLMMGVLNLMRGSNGDSSMLKALQEGTLSGGHLEEIKLILLLVVLFTAFFCFTMAVRVYNHVGFLINSSSARLQFSPTSAYVSRLLNRGGAFFSYGMRAYYVSVPLVFGLFSPYYLAIASIVLVITLHHLDRAPEVQTNDSDIRKHTPSSRFHYIAPSPEMRSDITGVFPANSTASKDDDGCN